MNKKYIIFALAALSVCCASCNKPDNGGKPGKDKSDYLTITASGRTWAESDSIYIYECTSDGMDKPAVSQKAVIENGKTTFKTKLSEAGKGKGGYSYIATYPSGNEVVSDHINVNIPQEQTYSSKTWDKAADAWFAISGESADRPAELDMRFAMAGSAIKMNISGIASDEIVESVTLTSDMTAITGNIAISKTGADIASTAAAASVATAAATSVSTATATSVATDAATSVSTATATSVSTATATSVATAAATSVTTAATGSGKTIVAKPETSAARSGVAWIRCLPGTLEGYSISIKTDKNTYTHYWTSSLEIKESKTTILDVDMTDYAPKENISIFLIGNSFTQDACHRLPGVLVGMGINNVEVTQCYYGGRTVPEYNDGWETSSDYTKHTALPGESVMKNTSGTNLKTVAQSKQWDIVCIQEHTGNYRAWKWTAEEKAAISQLMEKVAATQEKRPKFFYIMSQTYYDMNKIGTSSQPYKTWTDQAGMYDVTVAFAKNVMNDLPFDGIIATGTALQNLRQTSLNNTMCLTRDGYHMDYGLSRFTAACTCYQVMLYPYLGIPLEECKFRITDLNTTVGSYTTPVTDANAPVAYAAARAAARCPYELTYINEKVGSNGSAGADLGIVNGQF